LVYGDQVYVKTSKRADNKREYDPRKRQSKFMYRRGFMNDEGIVESKPEGVDRYYRNVQGKESDTA